MSFVISTILLAAMGCPTLAASDIPELFPVAVVTDHFELGLHDVKRSWQTNDVQMWTREAWVAKFGPITKEDEDDYQTYGCLRFHTVLHHYDI